MISLLSTIVIVLVVVYIEGIKSYISLSSDRVRNVNDKYEVKLLYTSNMPIILQSGLISNLFAITQLLYDKFKYIFLVELLAT